MFTPGMFSSGPCAVCQTTSGMCLSASRMATPFSRNATGSASFVPSSTTTTSGRSAACDSAAVTAELVPRPMTASNPIVQPGERLEDPGLRAVGDGVADHERRRWVARAQPWQTEPAFHGVVVRHDERLVVARHAVHLDVATVAEREGARRERVQRRRPPFADEPLRVARPGADLDHDRLVGGAAEPHELLRWDASVVTEQHQGARRRQFSRHGTAGGPERRRRLGRGLGRGHARRDRTGDGAEREHGGERSSHRDTVSSGTREPGPSPGCGGCGAPFAPRARSEPVGVRERPVRPGRSSGRRARDGRTACRARSPSE